MGPGAAPPEATAAGAGASGRPGCCCSRAAPSLINIYLITYGLERDNDGGDSRGE